MNEQPHLRYEVAYPERLSRILIFIKWLLIFPHLFVLAVLGFALYFSSIFAFFAILITGRYPRGLWGFAVMVLRWQANVNAYVYLQRDEYPPFGEDAPYPVRFDLAYPDRLSRLLIFVKWLLVIPHFVVLYVLGIFISLIMFISWFAILFTGRFPYGLFELVSGYMRWQYRVAVYVGLLTDAYPPFSMSDTSGPYLTDRRPTSLLPATNATVVTNGVRCVPSHLLGMCLYRTYDSCHP